MKKISLKETLLKTALPVITSITLFTTSIVPTIATHAETTDISAAGTTSCTVGFTMDSTYIVQVPLSVDLVKQEEGVFVGGFDINCKGNIKGNEVVTVSVPSYVTLTGTTTSSTATLTPNFDTLYFVRTVTDLETQCNINATDFTSVEGILTARDISVADNYTGNLVFTINLATL